jgi:type I restriction enzyme S subunit
MSELPEGWAEATVTEIVGLHDARRVPLNAAQRAGMKGNFPYYGANGLVDHVDDYLFDGDYVLLAEDGGYFDDPSRGVAYEVSGRFWVNNHAHILKPLGGISPRYLCHQLNAVDWMPFVGGSTRLKLTQGGLERARVPLPPRPEQRRIVAKIDSLTGKSRRARDHLDHIPRLVEKYKQAVLAAAFRGELTREWRAQRGTPAGYQTASLADVLTDIRYGTAKKCDYDGGATPVLRIPNVQKGEIALEDLKSADFEEAELRKLRLRSGDLLVIRSNGSLGLVGRCAIVNEAAAEMLFAGYLIRLRFDAGTVLPRYAHLWFQSASIRSVIEGLAKSTSGVNNINSKQIEQLPITLASLDEQREIVRRIETAFAWIDRLSAEATSARRLIDRLDQAVLAKAFRGELVPQDPADEPASLLLERIRAEQAGTAPKTKRGRKAKAA